LCDRKELLSLRDCHQIVTNGAVSEMSLIDQPNISEIVKNYAQVAAWAAGAAYFLFKAVQGYLVIDMSVAVRATRQNSADAEYLSVEVEMNKGSRGSFRLFDAIILIEQDGARQEERINVAHFGFTQTGRQLSIDLNRQKPTQYLAAGETMKVGRWFKVAKDRPCLVEVIILGTGFGSLVVESRRASTVSLPIGLPVSGK